MRRLHVLELKIVGELDVFLPNVRRLWVFGLAVAAFPFQEPRSSDDEDDYDDD